MTTTMSPPEPAAPAERPQRTLPIAANLLPEEVTGARRTRKVRRAVLSALVAYLVLLGAWYGWATMKTSTAQDELSATQDDVQRLQRQQNNFGELLAAQAESRSIRSQLSSLLVDDIRWSEQLRALQQAEPGGVRITNVTASLTSEADKAAAVTAADSQLPSAAAEKTIGTVTVAGTGQSKTAIAAYIDALGKVKGLANPMFGGATTHDEVLQFTVRLDITAVALSGRYTAMTDGSGES